VGEGHWIGFLGRGGCGGSIEGVGHQIFGIEASVSPRIVDIKDLFFI